MVCFFCYFNVRLYADALIFIGLFVCLYPGDIFCFSFLVKRTIVYYFRYTYCANDFISVSCSIYLATYITPTNVWFCSIRYFSFAVQYIYVLYPISSYIYLYCSIEIFIRYEIYLCYLGFVFFLGFFFAFCKGKVCVCFLIVSYFRSNIKRIFQSYIFLSYFIRFSFVLNRKVKGNIFWEKVLL